MASDDQPKRGETEAAQTITHDDRASFERQARAAAERYFALWPDEREAVLAAHHREGVEVGKLLNADMVAVARELDEIIAASPDRATITRWPAAVEEPFRRGDETFRRAFGWVVTEMATYSGPLVAALSGFIPVFTDEELVANMTATDLRATVPIAIEQLPQPPQPGPIVIDKAPPASGVNHAMREAILGSSPAQIGFEPVHRDEMPKALRDRFDAMLQAYGDFYLTAGIIVSGDSTPPETRKSYREFTSAFYAWFNKAPADRRRLRYTSQSLVSGAKVMPFLRVTPTQVAIESLIADDKERAWQNLRTPRPPMHGDPAGTHVTIGDPRTAALSREQQLAAAETVLKLSDEHAQTFVYLMARWIAENEGLAVPQAARVHVNELLDFRELVRKKRDFKAEQKREEGTRILHLNAIWVRVLEKVAPRGKTRRTKTVNVYSRLIELSIETEADSTGAPIPMMFDDVPLDSVPYAFRFRPGSWIESYWGNAAHASLIFKKVLGYNTQERSGRMAMRITFYLSFVPFRQDVTTVEDLLRAAHISIPETQPKRSREAFDDALGKLRDDGIIESYEYIGGDPPDTGKGWRNIWLASRVRIRVANDRDQLRSEIAALPPLG